MELVKQHLEQAKAEMPKDIIEAHEHSINHRQEIEASKLCGCFDCLYTFSPSEITEWITSGPGDEFAMCPRCGIDSVIGDASGYPITDKFLREMNKYWFDGNIPFAD